MELLKPDGRIISGLPCMYYLMNGVILFSEAVPDDGTDYHFEAGKTLFIVPSAPDPTTHMQNVAHGKGFGPMFPGAPSTLRMPRLFAMVSDCTDPGMLKNWRAAVSGIVIAGKLPTETEH